MISSHKSDIWIANSMASSRSWFLLSVILFYSFILSITTPAVCRYVRRWRTRYQYLRYVDMLLRNSICFRYAQTRYMLISFAFGMLPLATSVDCAFFLHALQGISSASAPYRVADISSDASAAHIDVESSCQRHDRFDMAGSGEQIKRKHLVCCVA